MNNEIKEVGPLISVVTCTFNDGKYLRETIQSVLSQTYQNIEYIIWDDGSTDNTKQIVDSFDDNRISYYHSKNMGIGYSTIMACKKANGVYIARIDGDDVWMPQKLEKQVEFLENNPEVVAVGTSEFFIDSESKIIGIGFQYSDNKVVMGMLKKGLIPILHSSSMFRLTDYHASGGYVHIRKTLDKLLWLRMRHIGEITNLPDHLTMYRLHPESITMTRDKGPYNQILKAILHKIYEEEGHNSGDVDIFNQLFQTNKRFIKTGNATQFSMSSIKFSWPLLLYRNLSSLLGEKNAKRMIFKIKDFIGYIKYCL